MGTLGISDQGFELQQTEEIPLIVKSVTNFIILFPLLRPFDFI